ncbi:hypothetical protein GOP47_0012550 [Adiantum capillus-veneris]|uniref:EF-hand domain-containing protein n=1 Tax=Adiantum capillus-veneris TaxID=13818 RepID=A0A9D4ZEI8_ADICA|nr:hypothetical protein GOP47_0012550 [Adiantum capillus-veneris]
MGNVASASHFEIISHKELRRAKKRFLKINGSLDSELDPEDFKRALSLGGNPCAERLFNVVDVDGSGGVSFKEVCQGVANRRSMSSKEAKLHVLFKFYDKDGDGRISRHEVAEAMQLACPELFPRATLEQLVQSTMQMFDTDKDGYLNFVEFSNLMKASGMDLSNDRI